MRFWLLVGLALILSSQSDACLISLLWERDPRVRNDDVTEGHSALAASDNPTTDIVTSRTPTGSGVQLSRIKVRDGWFVDPGGRVRLFHGFNAVEKGEPFYPATLLNDTRLGLYRRWGFNAVRLGTMWSGFEPAEGRFNETHIAIMGDIVDRLARHGMYAILDMHQDLASSKFRSYDGLPLWLVNKLPPSPHPYPWPLKETWFWAEGYLSQAVGRVFQALYDNTLGAADSLARFWTRVAVAFRDRTSVLGYELINEPWAGDIYRDPDLLLPGEAGRRSLMPLYRRLHRAIRAVDNATVVFYEPVTWGVVFQGNATGSGFTSFPGGESYRDRSVFSLHYYCWFMGANAQHVDYPILLRTVCDVIFGPTVFRTAAAEASRAGGGLFLTEFGRCSPDGNPSSGGTLECRSVLDQADKALVSWTYWDSTFFNGNGSVNTATVHVFARPFATAVAGTPLYMSFSERFAIFRFGFRADVTISLPTQVFVPREHYGHGFRVTLPSEFRWTFDGDESLLSIFPRDRQSTGTCRLIIMPS